MAKLLHDLHQLTLEILSDLNTINYEQLEDFVGNRERIIIQLQSVQLMLGDKEKSQIEDILEHDVLILSRMQRLKEEAAAGINKLDRARVQNEAYYAEYTPDSIFFDKRK